MMIDDAPVEDLESLLRLADLQVAECAAVLSEAIAMRDVVRLALRKRKGLYDA